MDDDNTFSPGHIQYEDYFELEQNTGYLIIYYDYTMNMFSILTSFCVLSKLLQQEGF